MASLKNIACGIIAAFLLWALMFSPLTAPHLNFWALMTLSALILSSLAFLSAGNWKQRLRFKLSDVAWGLAIAGGLWCIFWAGEAVSAQLFDFAKPEVQAIYSIREKLSPLALSMLLMCLIGPAEEIFWRGYIQEQLSLRWGANTGLILTCALYTAVHLSSCNYMLVMASCVAGSAWGICYRLFPRRFPAIILSHALWDAAVFIWFPIH